MVLGFVLEFRRKRSVESGLSGSLFLMAATTAREAEKEDECGRSKSGEGHDANSNTSDGTRGKG